MLRPPVRIAERFHARRTGGERLRAPVQRLERALELCGAYHIATTKRRAFSVTWECGGRRACGDESWARPGSGPCTTAALQPHHAQELPRQAVITHRFLSGLLVRSVWSVDCYLFRLFLTFLHSVRYNHKTCALVIVACAEARKSETSHTTLPRCATASTRLYRGS